MHDEFSFIEDICIQNSYPKPFIDCQIRKTLGRYFDRLNRTNIYPSNRKDKTKDSKKKERIFIDISFIGKPTEILGKRLINIGKSINPQIHLQPIQRPPPTISRYFLIEDPVPKILKSNIVYKINCSECDAFYIGKTNRQAYGRFQEHGANLEKPKRIKPKQAIAPTTNTSLRRSDRNKGKIVQYFSQSNEPNLDEEYVNNFSNNIRKSAIKQHEIDNNHRINWTDWNIISKDINKYRLLVGESLAIN